MTAPFYNWVHPRRPSWAWKVLSSLAMEGPTTCSGLYHRLGGTHDTISARLQELEELGLVSRWSPPHEPGVGPAKSIFRLTAAGNKLLERADAPEVLTDLYTIYRGHCEDRADALREVKAFWSTRIRSSMAKAVRRAGERSPVA